ncbi:MAG: double-strand break repair helicase AddA [Cypionkella sp.]|nr:double-strand break repair helicase AddA [Cypionkella sp.]
MLDPASEAQHRAAQPHISTWLSANAGSGKTKVLIDRVARLLLSGVSPQHILCLTYTKAAATEMQNRLFEELGKWAMMPEGDLRRALAALGDDGLAERPMEGAVLARARQLFARAIESPGGLRIQTIHSFCATLLRRFPLEAGVSPNFTEMDDRAARKMREEIIEEMADHLAPDVVADVARYHTGADFLGLMGAIAADAVGFARPLTTAAAGHLFGLSGNETEAGLLSQVLIGGEGDLIAALIPYLQAGSVTDQNNARKLAAIDLSVENTSLIAQLESIFLFGGTAKNPYAAKIDSLPTKATRCALPPHISAQLDALMLRVEAARSLRIALFAAQKTAALHRFAAAFLPLYDAAKAARGLLDFDDLIARAIHLLTDRSVAAWVLFRLDGGIDHILVDEAQDTSPKQWRVIELLAEEFTAGAGAQNQARTLFVVGDKKQSIYSFQGADVAIFDEKRASFAEKFAAAQLPFQPLELQHSFRSSPAILRVVDNIFAHRFSRAMGDSVSHLAFHETMAGRVDVWPVYETDKDESDLDPRDITPRQSQTSAVWQLAQDVAQHIKSLLDSGAQIPTKKGVRGVQAGDVLILVQRRSGIFHHIIRACKQLQLPIAGADRLKLGGEMAVRDLTALLTFLATPEDDLALAAALRSPLFGLDEAQLFDLAQGRTGYLWAALRGHADHGDTLAILSDLLDSADFLRPYDLLERALTRHNGRLRLITRLGPEAEEGVDVLLSQALAYEQGEVPSLTGFLLWLDDDDFTIKRQVDSASNQIRVMTVHGAKGLEAPIVYLPDCAEPNARDRAEVIALDTGERVWKTSADESPPATAAAVAARKEASDDERLRLLYVALTRAQSWLIVAAAGKVTGEATWHALVDQGVRAAGAMGLANGGQRHAFGDWPIGARGKDDASPQPEAALPAWALAKAASALRPAQPFAPSRLSGAKTVGGEGDPDALEYGTAVHLLLEYLPQLPPADWHAFATRHAPVGALDEAQRLLQSPDLAPIFAHGLAEVPLTAGTDKGQMMGLIDRLLVRDDHVLAVDFKTNRAVPTDAAGVPVGLLAQMGAYLIALEQIYPRHRIDLAILWTKTAHLMRLDHDMMRAAFHRAAIS